MSEPDIYDPAYSTNFGSAEGIAGMLRAQGLEVRYHRFFFGCATGVSGRKPKDLS